MSSWVRYCVAVYIGLLFSGALARPPWTRPSHADAVHPGERVMPVQPVGGAVKSDDDGPGAKPEADEPDAQGGCATLER